MAIGCYLRPLLIFLNIHAIGSTRPEEHHLALALPAAGQQAESAEPAELVEEAPAPQGASPSYCKQVFQPRHSARYMVLGTRENMDPRFAELELDLGGLWWMKGSPGPEVLATFAGAIVNSSEYPALLSIPSGRNPGHWAWRENAVATGLMTLYSSSNPKNPIIFDMASPTRGFVDKAKQNPVVLVEDQDFSFLNKDEWNRTSTLQSGSPWYVLTRILNEDGSPTKFWAEFLDILQKSNLQMFTTQDACSMRSFTHGIPSWMGVTLFAAAALVSFLCAGGRGQKMKEMQGMIQMIEEEPYL